MTNAKPVDQREHRDKPKVVDIESYKTREIPELTGRTLKIPKYGGITFGLAIYLVQLI